MQIKYQVIILGGGEKSGNTLYPFCQKFLKSLLPINNKPMILYQLDVLETVGFSPQDILILITKTISLLLILFKEQQKCFMLVIILNQDLHYWKHKKKLKKFHSSFQLHYDRSPIYWICWIFIIRKKQQSHI